MKKYNPRSHERREFCHPTMERNGRNAQIASIPQWFGERVKSTRGDVRKTERQSVVIP